MQIPTVTKTAPTPAYSVAGQTGAGPDIGPAAPPGDGEQHATPPRLAHTLTGHTGGWFNHWVNSVASSPDGQLLACGSYDSVVRLWDPVDRKLVGELSGHTGAVSAATFGSLPDGRVVLLASESYDNVVRLWDPVIHVAVGEPLHGHTGAVTAVAFGRLPGRRVLLASGSDDGVVRLWDPATGVAVGELSGHTGAVTAVAFGRLPDRRVLLASGSYDGVVRLWDPATGVAVGELSGHTGAVTTVAFGSLPGRRVLLASGSYDGVVRLWDPATGVAVGELFGHTGAVTAVAFGYQPDGWVLLASGSYDHLVRLWNPATGGPWPRLPGHTSSSQLCGVQPQWTAAGQLQQRQDGAAVEPTPVGMIADGAWPIRTRGFGTGRAVQPLALAMILVGPPGRPGVGETTVTPTLPCGPAPVDVPKSSARLSSSFRQRVRRTMEIQPVVRAPVHCAGSVRTRVREGAPRARVWGHPRHFPRSADDGRIDRPGRRPEPVSGRRSQAK